MNNNKQHIESRLQRIANVLLLNASFTDNLGLLNGKMGIAIFFFHYARYTGNEMYENYAGELIDEIYEEISPTSPINFAAGVTGIAWGIEYLVKNGFVEADTDKALNEIDSVIFRATTQLPVYIENQDDLFGFGIYYLARLNGREHDMDNTSVLFMKQMTVYMVDECERLLVQQKFHDVNIPRLSAGLVNSIMFFLLEVHRLGLFPVKVNKLLRYLPSYMEASISAKDSQVDLQTMLQFAKKIFIIVSDTDIKDQFKHLINQLSNMSEDTDNNNAIVDGICRLNWHSLVYQSAVNNNVELLFKKTFHIVDNEENWNQRLNILNKDNLGLDKGLAGLGLAFLSEIIKN